MEYLLLYLCFGAPIGLIEFVAVLFIRNSGSPWLKFVYGLIALIAWPLIFALIFVPNRILKKVRNNLVRRLYE